MAMPDVKDMQHIVRGVSEKALEECIKRSPEVTRVGRFDCSKPNLQQIPKNVCSKCNGDGYITCPHDIEENNICGHQHEAICNPLKNIKEGCKLICPKCEGDSESNNSIICPECKDKGEVPCENCDGTGETMRMVCYGDMPYEVREICEECDDGMVECPKCEGGKEIDMGSIMIEGKHVRMSRSGVKLLVDKIGGRSLDTENDFKNLVIVIIKNRSIYKSHLIMAIVERYYIHDNHTPDYTIGQDKYYYDNVDNRMYYLSRKGVLEPYVKGEVLKLKVHSSEVVECPDCKGEGRVICPNDSNDELDSCNTCPDDSPLCRIKCSTCKGEGTIRVTPILGGMIQSSNMLGDAIAYSYSAIRPEWQRKQKRRTRKKYEMSKEEFKIKRGKATRKKYEIREGDLK